ncbi:hypothetical protein ACFXJ8_01455 [Nonomuraea sp. NPDC059194]|uniref:hypothetical protein n=1 Tax=Nonomuraea sp. NPDC059194 TaxID=3346764 RepID=UPI0036CAC2AA
MVRRKVAATLAALTLATGVVGSGSPAAADAGSNLHNCPIGYFCIYSSVGQVNRVMLWEGNWNYNSTGIGNIRSVFNNGTEGGRDHVLANYTYRYEGKNYNRTDCFHVATPDRPWDGERSWYFNVTIHSVLWTYASHSLCDG